MSRPIKILFLILGILLLFTLGKWLVIDSLLAGSENNGRYRIEAATSPDQ